MKKADTLDGKDPEELKYYEEIGFETLSALVNAVTTVSERLIMFELKSALEKKEIRARIKDGMMRYLYAAGLLSFAGREITRESLADVVQSIGIKPNYEFVDILIKCDIKSHLIYVYAYYYLLANGKEINEKDMFKILGTFNIKPDRNRITEILEFVSKP